MELNKILEGVSPVGMNEGDKVIIEIIKGVATIRFEPAKNENFLDDMVEDDCEKLEDEDLEDDDEEEDYDDEEEDYEHYKEHKKDIETITILEKLLEVLKNILKS